MRDYGTVADDRLAMAKITTYHRLMPTAFTRLVRAALLAMALVLVGTALVLGWDWLRVINSSRLFAGNGTAFFLAALLPGYFVLLAAAASVWDGWSGGRGEGASPRQDRGQV